MKIKSTVREQKSKLGTFGKIVSQDLAEFIGKDIEFEPKIVKEK